MYVTTPDPSYELPFLKALWNNPEGFALVPKTLRAEHFANPYHGEIFEVLRDHYKQYGTSRHVSRDYAVRSRLTARRGR